MDFLILFLIIFQAVLTAFGYFALSRKVQDLRKKIDLYLDVASIVPIVFIALIVGSKFPNITFEQAITFVYFAMGSAVVNIIDGTIIYFYEKNLLKSARHY